MTELIASDAMVELAKTFIMGELLILIPVLYFLGFIMKRTEQLPDWLIPWLIIALGILFAVLLVGLTPEGILQGILIAGATVLTHQLYKQTTERE